MKWRDKLGREYSIHQGGENPMTTKHLWYAMRYVWRKATSLSHLPPAVTAKLKVVDDVFDSLLATDLQRPPIKKAPSTYSRQNGRKLVCNPVPGDNSNQSAVNPVSGEQVSRPVDQVSVEEIVDEPEPNYASAQGDSEQIEDWTFDERRREEMLVQWGFYEMLAEYKMRTDETPSFYKGKKDK